MTDAVLLHGREDVATLVGVPTCRVAEAASDGIERWRVTDNGQSSI
jgi:hypothetical protein